MRSKFNSSNGVAANDLNNALVKAQMIGNWMRVGKQEPAGSP